METENLSRADVALVARKLAASRERAQALINAGLVTCNGRAVGKCALKVSDADILEVHGAEHPYVSRGGLKLEKALAAFGADPSGKICIDVGASTGGFTDVLLKGGASRVYAVDVGTGQLDPILAADPRVVSMEHTNARTLHASMFPQHPTLGVMDVSFISICLILPAAFSVLGEKGRMISLIKPQFECGPQSLGKKGLVNDPRVHIRVLQQIVDFVPSLGWRVRALEFSPITGTSGNLEFLGDFLPAAQCQSSPTSDDIRQLVSAAHRQLKG